MLLVLTALSTFAFPVLAARCAWSVLPDVRWGPLRGVLHLLSSGDDGVGLTLDVGDDWSFECVKLRCPAESLGCLFDAGCRALVLEVALTDSCSREQTRERICGTDCSAASLAFMRCLDGVGAPCVYASGGEAYVVERGALSESAMQLIAELAAKAEGQYGHKHRTFGAGNSTTGHNVTWLTPGIYSHPQLLNTLQRLAASAARKGGWRVRAVGALELRCAELLAYDGRGSAGGLGWHWDLGSTITMVAMLKASDGDDGQLQVSTSAAGSTRCKVSRVPLERGDVAIYRSHTRHRVTRVSQPRSVAAFEWWRGPATLSPTRPAIEAWRLQEPDTRQLKLGLGGGGLRGGDGGGEDGEEGEQGEEDPHWDL